MLFDVLMLAGIVLAASAFVVAKWKVALQLLALTCLTAAYMLHQVVFWACLAAAALTLDVRQWWAGVDRSVVRHPLRALRAARGHKGRRSR